VWAHESERLKDLAADVDAESVSLSGFFKLGQYRDIVAQVIGVYVTNRKTVAVRIWDGTRFS